MENMEENHHIEMNEQEVKKSIFSSHLFFF